MNDFLIRPYEFGRSSIHPRGFLNQMYHITLPPEEAEDLKHYLENEIEDYFRHPSGWKNHWSRWNKL
ncbi:Uncharacterised protein [Sphingobacterium daejeonense]|nr:Uncharacterised protein [Sphingobacterium daejeonense]